MKIIASLLLHLLLFTCSSSSSRSSSSSNKSSNGGLWTSRKATGTSGNLPPPNNGGVNPFITSSTYNPAPPPHLLQVKVFLYLTLVFLSYVTYLLLQGPDYQKQILTQRDARPTSNDTNDDAYMAAPTDDNTDPRTLAFNGIILSVTGFIVFMIMLSLLVSRIKSKALQAEEDKKYEEMLQDIRMVSVGTQWDDNVIPLLPIAYNDTSKIGFQVTGGINGSSTFNGSSKLPPIRKKLKVRKSADGTIRSAVVMPENGSKGKGVEPQEQVSIGTMTIKCQRGINIKAGHSLFGYADPYCVMKIGSEEQKTKFQAVGGKNPVWNEEFVYNVYDENTEIEITIFDKETVGPDRFMAHCKVSIIEWIRLGRFEGELALTDKSNKPEGKLEIVAFFTKV